MKHFTLGVAVALVATGCQTSSTSSNLEFFELPAPSIADGNKLPDEVHGITGNDDEWVQAYRGSLNSNGDIIAAKALYNAALQQIQIVGAYPEPRLMIGGFAQPLETRNGPLQFKLGVQQKLPNHLRIDHKVSREQMNAKAAAAHVVDVQLQIRQQLVELWAQRIHTSNSIEILESQVSLLTDIHELVLAKFESGLTTQAQVLRTNLATTKLRDQISKLETAALILNEKVSTLSHTDISGIDWQAQKYPLQNIGALDYTSGYLRPKLMRLEFLMQAASQEIDIADSLSTPDLVIGLDYSMIGEQPGIAASGDDAIAVQLAFDIPFGNQPYEALTQSAKQKWQSKKWQAQQEQRKSDSVLNNSVRLLEDALRRSALYQDQFLPTADHALTATLQSYQAGQASLQDVLDASSQILNYRLQLEHSLADSCKARAAIAGQILIQGNQND
ncbi:MAG: TolC family protein [Planctomycetota bacterium]|jgi:outer membrane protein TolC|nr:TolC family protein [Planctomycetota bacterium]